MEGKTAAIVLSSLLSSSEEGAVAATGLEVGLETVVDVEVFLPHFAARASVMVKVL